MSGAHAAAIVLLGTIAAPLAQRDPAVVFRSRTDVVSVPVVVLSGRRHVTDLTLGEFALKDNGVPQTIEAVEQIAEVMPIDVSLVVDVSGSTEGSLERYRSDVRQMAAMLRAEDRVRLVAFGTSVVEVFTLRHPDTDLPFHQLRTMGLTALNDALVSVLVRPVPFDRAHLVIVFTDAGDTISVTTMSMVRDIAARSDAVLHAVLTSGAATSATQGLQPLIGPSYPDGRQALIEIAESTGGRRGWPGVFSSSAVGAFREALDDFRASYVLRYRPQGVPLEGWHDITVQVKRRGNFTIRARRGYSSQ